VTEPRLDDEERAVLAGERGEAARWCGELIVQLAHMQSAPSLIPVTRAHVDSCLYHGQASVDFARFLVARGARVTIPTTLNVGAIDLIHPELFHGKPSVSEAARELVRCYAEMGCRQTWTCAPYQLADRPALGEQVAWAESNAIVFANSALGARTERYGDFIDIAAAVFGRVPNVGLHTDAGRRATLRVELRGIGDALKRSDVLFAALGHVIGKAAGSAVPVVEGLEAATEDQLKALGAAGASSGALAMFHIVGVTPEAPTVRAACGGVNAVAVMRVTPEDVKRAAAELTSAEDGELGTVSVGTPHFSFDEFATLVALLGGRVVAHGLEFYCSTGRDVLARVRERGWLELLGASGVRVVTDTCTYITPIMRERPGTVMTNSAKWAWYAPNNLGVRVVFGSLAECVESAVRGRVWRDEALFG
jgi:hypothetical protein